MNQRPARPDPSAAEAELIAGIKAMRHVVGDSALPRLEAEREFIGQMASWLQTEADTLRSEVRGVDHAALRNPPRDMTDPSHEDGYFESCLEDAALMERLALILRREYL